MSNFCIQRWLEKADCVFLYHKKTDAFWRVHPESHWAIALILQFLAYLFKSSSLWYLNHHHYDHNHYWEPNLYWLLFYICKFTYTILALGKLLNIPCFSYLLWHNKSPHSLVAKIRNINYLTNSVGQESVHGLAESSVSAMGPHCGLIWRLALEKIHFQVHSHSYWQDPFPQGLLEWAPLHFTGCWLNASLSSLPHDSLQGSAEGVRKTSKMEAVGFIDSSRRWY